MKRYALLALVLVLAVTGGLLAGCSKGSKEIVIGFVGPLTGGSSFLGETGQKAVQLAVDEINAQGGVRGKQIRVVFENDQSTPADGLAAVNKLIDQDKAIALIGPFNSSVTLAILDTIETKKVPIITTACNTTICSQGKQFVFRATFDNKVQGIGLANYVLGDLGITKVAVLYPNDDFGIELKDFFVQTAEAKTGVDLASIQGYNGGTTDFYGILTGIKPLKPQAIILCGYVEDSAQIMRQAKELGIKTLFFGYGALADDSLQTLAGAACEGLRLVTTFEPNYPLNQVGTDLVAKYKAKYGEDANNYSGESYGAILTLLDALDRAVTLDGQGVRDAIATANLDVPIGTMSFDATGQCSAKMVIAEIKDGKRVLSDVQPQ